MLLQLRSCSHWGCRILENKKWEVAQQTSSLCVKDAHMHSQVAFCLVRYGFWQIAGWGPVNEISVKYIEQCLPVSAQAWEWHYSLIVLLLRTRTWMARLTLASEGSGLIAKLQPIHVYLQMWSYSYWGCRMLENKRQFNKLLHFVCESVKRIGQWSQVSAKVW